MIKLYRGQMHLEKIWSHLTIKKLLLIHNVPCCNDAKLSACTGVQENDLFNKAETIIQA